MSAQQGEFTILLCARQPTTLARKWVNAKLLKMAVTVVITGLSGFMGCGDFLWHDSFIINPCSDLIMGIFK